MRCPVCGAETGDEDRFCSSCGAQQQEHTPDPLGAAGQGDRGQDARSVSGGEVPSVTHVASCDGASRAPRASSVGASQQATSLTPAKRAMARAARSRPPANVGAPQEVARPRRTRPTCCLLVAVPALLVILVVVGVSVLWATMPEAIPGRLGVTTGVDSGERAAAPIPTMAGLAPPVPRLSPDQQRLVDRLSHPHTFSLIMDRDEDVESGGTKAVRLEIWNYHTLGTCFTFIDGTFQGVDAAREISGGEYPPLHPEQFSEEMTVAEVNELLGDIPYAGAAPVPEIFAGAEIYVYEQGLVIAIVDGRLAYASTEWAPPTDVD